MEIIQQNDSLNRFSITYIQNVVICCNFYCVDKQNSMFTVTHLDFPKSVNFFFYYLLGFFHKLHLFNTIFEK